jgi:hypothetical protein
VVHHRGKRQLVVLSLFNGVDGFLQASGLTIARRPN